jgi:hypothetical protein
MTQGERERTSERGTRRGRDKESETGGREGVRSLCGIHDRPSCVVLLIY